MATRKLTNNRSRSGRKLRKAKRISAAIRKFTDGVARFEGMEVDLGPKRRPRQLLTSKQAAHVLGVAPKTLANWRTLGTGPAFHKTGGRCLYLRKDLITFAKSRKVSSTSAYAAMPLHGGCQNG